MEKVKDSDGFVALAEAIHAQRVVDMLERKDPVLTAVHACLGATCYERETSEDVFTWRIMEGEQKEGNFTGHRALLHVLLTREKGRPTTYQIAIEYTRGDVTCTDMMTSAAALVRLDKIFEGFLGEVE